MTNCPFCKRIQEKNVFVDGDTAVTLSDGLPISPGHSLIVPWRHVANFFDLSPEEQTAVWTMVGTVRRMLDEQYRPDAYNVGINVGDVAGQTVEHAHVHVVPRYRGATSTLCCQSAGLPYSTCCHTFLATGITAYLENGGTIEECPGDRCARIAAHHEALRSHQR